MGYMCYTKAVDGTPCLFLCIPLDPRIMSVEMIGGRTRWEVGKEQMGEKLRPLSICTDDKDTIYVADFSQRKIHLLSASDGSVIKWPYPGNLGVRNIFTVRFHDTRRLSISGSLVKCFLLVVWLSVGNFVQFSPIQNWILFRQSAIAIHNILFYNKRLFVEISYANKKN